MFLVEFHQSPHSEVYAGLGVCYSHAAYCHFHMFKGPDVAGEGWGGEAAGSRGQKCENLQMAITLKP